MIIYDAIALNREQRKTLSEGQPIEHARDAIHAHAATTLKIPLIWATSFHAIYAMTHHPEFPMTPFIVRYIIEARDAVS